MALGPQNPASPGDDKNKEKKDTENDVFMREVDDALREDQLANFWEKYGRWLIGLVVLGLAAFAGWLIYQNQQEEAAGTTGEEYMTAIDAITKRQNLDGASEVLKPLEESNSEGYRAASKMLQAGIMLEKDQVKEATRAYGNIASDENLPQIYRDAALIRQTAAEFDALKPETVVARLKPLAVPGNAWFGSAGEMTAIAYIKMEKPDMAGPLFEQLAKDKNVPESIRDRAKQMAGQFGIDVIDDEEAEAVAKAAGVSVTRGADAPAAAPASEGTSE
ncbi:tetratricopeptide repeat protein [Sphingorhabdus sp. Alg239-R122]|uniref:tetratricopeptide repeat protein n=1 Tax=Sphingorhabdus sp. Alg239-R122 TaxID=2305989 RepID=UPI001F074F35|nr:tetratricopeptide repeat protein [Sphingorhabdus sp. Alg239-R122]